MRRQVLVAISVWVLVSLACGSPPELTPTPTATLAPVAPSPEPIDTGWQTIGAGLEARRLRVEIGTSSDRLWMVRVDPARARFRVVYDPANPHSVRGWLESFDGVSDSLSAPAQNGHPRLAVNAGYFTPEKAATALVVSDGVRSGQSYVGFGGMFAVSDGQVQVRSLMARPYSPDERLDQAVQAFPMLVQAGGFPAVTEDDGRISRRTVVGQDRVGRVVFVVSATPLFSLKTLSAFLVASDLDLDVALNLDGGTSSGLWYSDQAGHPAGADSWIQVPAVIVVE